MFGTYWPKDTSHFRRLHSSAVPLWESQISHEAYKHFTTWGPPNFAVHITRFFLKFSKNLWIHRFCLTNSPDTCSEAWSCLRSCIVLVNRCSLPQFMFGSQNNLHSHSLIWPNPYREACLCNERVVLHFPVHTFSNISILAFFWVHSTTDLELCPH
jgi:hypothetical protein